MYNEYFTSEGSEGRIAGCSLLSVERCDGSASLSVERCDGSASLVFLSYANLD